MFLKAKIKIFSVLLIIFQSSFSFSDTFIYSGGCFWCTEADTEKLPGVISVISGFTSGTTPNPKYYPGEWGDHREAALVNFNPNLISLPDMFSSKL